MRAENPSSDSERWKFSAVNTLRWQSIGEKERDHLIWENESGIKDWSMFYINDGENNDI